MCLWCKHLRKAHRPRGQVLQGLECSIAGGRLRVGGQGQHRRDEAEGPQAAATEQHIHQLGTRLAHMVGLHIDAVCELLHKATVKGAERLLDAYATFWCCLTLWSCLVQLPRGECCDFIDLGLWLILLHCFLTIVGEACCSANGTRTNRSGQLTGGCQS